MSKSKGTYYFQMEYIKLSIKLSVLCIRNLCNFAKNLK